MSEWIDFSSCPRVPGRAYNGANGKKIAVEYEGSVWLLKFSPSAAGVLNTLAYSNGCISEHIGSTVFQKLGIPAQETRLGVFVNGKTRMVCACRDFTVPDKRFYDFCAIKNSVVDSETCGTGTELTDVLETIEGQQFLDPYEVLSWFWDVFVVDALLGNFDRHNGNWGFLVEPATNHVSLAPVFDNGSCLLPQADEQIMRTVLHDEAELNARIYTFPNSMLKLGGRKINYHDFIAAKPYPGLKAALARLLPQIESLDVSALIADVPQLTDLQREFYTRYLSARREKLFLGHKI